MKRKDTNMHNIVDCDRCEILAFLRFTGGLGLQHITKWQSLVSGQIFVSETSKQHIYIWTHIYQGFLVRTKPCFLGFFPHFHGCPSSANVFMWVHVCVRRSLMKHMSSSHTGTVSSWHMHTCTHASLVFLSLWGLWNTQTAFWICKGLLKCPQFPNMSSLNTM